MNAYVTQPSSMLGTSLTGALRWEGHSIVSTALEAEVVFDTANGVIYRRDRPLARFILGEMLGPGEVHGTTVGDWVQRYIETGYLPYGAGGACISDARDVAIAMLTAAERGVSGEFETIGPFVTFDEMADIVRGLGQARTSVAIPELGIAFRPVDETINDVIAWERSKVTGSVV